MNESLAKWYALIDGRADASLDWRESMKEILRRVAAEEREACLRAVQWADCEGPGSHHHCRCKALAEQAICARDSRPDQG